MYLGSWKIDDFLTFYVNTHTAATGAATDADAVPPYRIYEDETGAAITNANMALLDAANTTGFYSERVQLLAATGFEKGKQYVIYIAATVAGVEGTISHTFQIEAEVDANTVSDGVDVTSVSGDSGAADNLESDYDGTGYNKTASTINTVTNVTNQVSADVTAVSGDATAADNLESDYDGTGYNKVNSTIGTTTSNTDMRGTDNALLAASAPANFSDLSITAITGRTDVASIEGSDATDQIRDSILDDATRFSGGDVDAAISTRATPAQVNTEVDTGLSDIRLDELINATAGGVDPATSSIMDLVMNKDGGQTFSQATDSLEAIRDRGDTAWTGSASQIIEVIELIPNTIDRANTTTWRLGMMLWNAVDDLPTTGEITPGTISIDRKAQGGAAWISIVSDAACSELAGLVYYDEVFNSATGYGNGDSIRITFKSQSVTADGNTIEISDANGRIFYTSIRDIISATNFPAGAIEFTYTLTNSVTTQPIDGADVWFSTDLAGTNIIWRGSTDVFGVALDVNNNKPFLDAGTYYVWRQKIGFTFTNPDTEVVS